MDTKRRNGETVSRNKVRFTAWLSQAELVAVQERATELGESASHVVREAVRESLGLRVTPVTRNDEATTGEP